MVSLLLVILVVSLGIFIFEMIVLLNKISELNKKNLEFVDQYGKEIEHIYNIIFKLRSDLELSRRRYGRKDYSKIRKE